MPKFTDSELLQSARYDAFHGVVVAAAMNDNHPMQKPLREHFSAIIAAIDAHTSIVETPPMPREKSDEDYEREYEATQ